MLISAVKLGIFLYLSYSMRMSAQRPEADAKPLQFLESPLEARVQMRVNPSGALY